MGSIPTPVNETANTVNGIISFTIFDVAVNAFEIYSKSLMPWLSLPIISTIFGYIVTKMASWFYVYFSTWATFHVIDHQTGAELSQYSKAEGNLRAVHLTGDQNAINQATDEFRKAVQALIQYDGQATGIVSH